MGSLAEVNATITAQNQAVAAQASAPPVEVAEKPASQAADEAKRSAQLEHQQTTAATEDKKADRKARLDGLRQLAQATEQKFTEAQLTRQQREKADGEIAAMRARLDAAEAKVKQSEDRVAAIDADPWGYMQKKGVKLRELAEKIAKQGTPDAAVEELKQQLLQQHEAHEAEVSKLRNEFEQAKRDAAERESRMAMQAQNAKARADFLDCVEKNKEKWPYLMKATRGVTERVIREFMVTFEEVKADPKTGPYIQDYSNEELLEATNVRIREMGVVVDSPAAPAVGKVSEAKPALTTSSAVEPQSLPMDFKRLSEKEKIKAMAAQYRATRKS